MQPANYTAHQKHFFCIIYFLFCMFFLPHLPSPEFSQVWFSVCPLKFPAFKGVTREMDFTSTPSHRHHHHSCTNTHARSSLPVNPNPNPTSPNLMELDYNILMLDLESVLPTDLDNLHDFKNLIILFKTKIKRPCTVQKTDLNKSWLFNFQPWFLPFTIFEHIQGCQVRVSKTLFPCQKSC